MLEQAQITFYKIDRCGYYRGHNSVAEYGHLPDTLNQLQQWAKAPGRLLRDTCTYEPDETAHSLKTFCHNLIGNATTGDYLLTTWNETPSNRGRVAAVQGNQPVGQATVTMNDIPDQSIPGYATYFWFLPSNGVFATIRFQHAVNGHDGMVNLMGGFLENFSNYVVRSAVPEQGVDQQVLGYALSPNHALEPLHPRFRTELFRKRSQVDWIIASYPSVRKIIRKKSLSATDAEDLSQWQKMLEMVGLGAARTQSKMDVKFEAPYKPTKREMETIVEHWQQGHGAKWDDIGFKLMGQQSVWWLSHALAKSPYNLEVTRDNDEVVNSDSLLTALTGIRAWGLNLLT